MEDAVDPWKRIVRRLGGVPLRTTSVGMSFLLYEGSSDDCLLSLRQFSTLFCFFNCIFTKILVLLINERKGAAGNAEPEG